MGIEEERQAIFDLLRENAEQMERILREVQEGYGGRVMYGRNGVGFELKPSYFRQAVANCAAAGDIRKEQETFNFDSPLEEI